MLPLSILDLAPIVEGGDAGAALRNTLDLAQHAERLGYQRYWLAEHHNMPGIASAATAVVIAAVAGVTSSIRVGSGGIMLPNHAPLVIAEQFGTLEALYPGRIDLGLGRAPGTDPRTAHALRRGLGDSAHSFPSDVVELLTYFRSPAPGQAVRAVPGAGSNVPVWLLGSSLFSAELAAELGLPFAFASHFAPDHLLDALEIYRSRFKPSPALSRPYVMPALGVIAADSDEQASLLSTSLQQAFVALRRGAPRPLPPPVENMAERWSRAEQATLEHVLRYAVVGSRQTVQRGVAAFAQLTQADELMITAQIFDHAARVKSLEILAQAAQPAMRPD